MAASYRLIQPSELDAGLIERWHAVQRVDTTFASPNFNPAFTQCAGRVRADARVVVIENDARVVGFFPFQTGALGLGRPIGGPLSDFHGVVAEPTAEWAADDLMRAARLAVWAFDHQVGGASRFEPFVRSHAVSPQIDLSAGYAAYVQGRRAAGSDYIPKTEGLARKLGREFGAVEFTLHDASENVFNTLTGWKSRQYREAGTIDGFKVPWTSALLRQILAAASPHFSGLCSTLRVDGRLVAGHIGMRSVTHLHYWFPVYDPEFAKFSTGIILLLRLAETLAAQGVKTIDLGKGDSPYKQRLMTGQVELGEGAIERPSWLSALRRAVRGAERLAQAEGAGAMRRLPLRIVRRLERDTKFR